MNSTAVAVIGGIGNQGFGLVLRWAKAGRRVVIGSRVHRRAVETAERARSLVVLAVPFEAQIVTLTALRSCLQAGQTLMDCTVPLQTAVGGSPASLLGVWHGSAAEQAAQHVPAGVQVEFGRTS